MERTPFGLPRPAVLAAAFAVIVVVGFGASVAIDGPRPRGWGTTADVATLAVALLASVVMVVRWRHDRRLNVAMMGLAVFSWTVGQAAFIVQYDIVGVEFWPAPSDVAFLLWPLCFGVALVHQASRLSIGRLVAVLSDAAVLASSICFLVWELYLQHRLSGHPWGEQLQMILIPVLDVSIVSIAAVLLLQQRSLNWSLVCLSTVFMAIGDTVYATSGESFDGQMAASASLWWVAALVTLAVAAGTPTVRRGGTRRPEEIVRLIAVYLPGLVAMCVAIQRYLVARDEVYDFTVVFAYLYLVVLAANQVVRWLEANSFANRLTASLDRLQTADRHMRNLLDDLPEAVLVIDRNGLIIDANSRTTRLTGDPPELLLGRHFAELATDDLREEVIGMWDVLQANEWSTESRQSPMFSMPNRVDPASPPVLVTADVLVPVRDADRVVVTLRDVTVRVQESAALERARERFRLAFHSAPIGMALSVASDARIIDVNEPLSEMLGLTREQLIGLTVADITYPEDYDHPDALMTSAGNGSNLAYRMEKRYIRADGTVLWARTWVSLLQEDDGEYLAIAHIEDITEQRRNAEQLEWAATHDELTRLPNRAVFSKELTARLQGAVLGSVAVLFIDIDNFKVINDSLGHATGDVLLRGMTERLLHALRPGDMLSRFGGDEFIVMLSDYATDSSPGAMAERLRHEIGKPLVVEDVELFVTASLGIAVADRPGATAGDLLRDADAAMYRAKARGRDCVEVFSPGAHDASVLALRTSNELRRGIERGEVVPYYQPIIDLSTGILTGFEVLARWRHPERGLLGADQFLPMAEETGLIAEVGASVLRTSLVQLGLWRDRLPAFADITIAVNVSGRQLLSHEFIDVVVEALGEAGVPAGQLWLEITETTLMTDVKAATVALRELRSLGLHLSVDDFGTGYSSLTYLKRFPVETIKIDRTFVNGLGIDPEDSTIVEAVINLGHSLGLDVVAEGVETPLQLARLRELGCDRGQGFLFGRPRPAEIIEAERSTT